MDAQHQNGGVEKGEQSRAPTRPCRNRKPPSRFIAEIEPIPIRKRSRSRRKPSLKWKEAVGRSRGEEFPTSMGTIRVLSPAAINDGVSVEPQLQIPPTPQFAAEVPEEPTEEEEEAMDAPLHAETSRTARQMVASMHGLTLQQVDTVCSVFEHMLPHAGRFCDPVRRAMRRLLNE